MKTNEWIKTSRERKGLTPEQLAQAIECSAASIRAWEKGTREPSAEMVARLMMFFGIPDKLEIKGVIYSKHRIPGTDRVLLGIDRTNADAHFREACNKRHPDRPMRDE